MELVVRPKTTRIRVSLQRVVKKTAIENWNADAGCLMPTSAFQAFQFVHYDKCGRDVYRAENLEFEYCRILISQAKSSSSIITREL